MFLCKVSCRCLVVVVSMTTFVLLSSGVVQAQNVLGDAFKRFDVEQKQPPQKVDAPDGQKVDDSDKGLTNEELLKSFYKEMEDLANGTDDFAKIAKSVKEELRDEFQANEDSLSKLSVSDLAGPPAHALLDRQNVIAQLYIELNTRMPSSDGRSQFELQRKINARFRDFRRKHPEAARDPNFHRKEQEIVSRIQGRRFGRNNVQTMAVVMEELAGGKCIRPEFESTRVHPGEEVGAIQQNLPVLRKLLKLKWDGPNLILDRNHWDEAYAGRNVEDIRVEVNEILRSAGAKTTGESEEALRRRQIAARVNSTKQPSNISRLFEELRGANSGSYSRSASGNNVQMSFSNGMINSRLKTTNNSFEFMLEENTGPGRFLRLIENTEGLQVMLVGDMVHRFRQDAAGEKLTAVEIVNDEVVSLDGETFADFYRRHPRFVEDRFFALLDHVGIVAPESRFDHRIVTRVVEYLKMDRDKLKQEVDELVEQLDASRFTTREAAYEKLRDGLDEYYDLLYSRKSDKTLSAEVKARVGKLLSLSEQGSASHYDTVISALGLVDDIEYLQELRDISDAAGQSVLDKRIAYLLTK